MCVHLKTKYTYYTPKTKVTFIITVFCMNITFCLLLDFKMRLLPPMQQYAQGRFRKNHARDPCKEPFPFQELLPMKLKNIISTKRDANNSMCSGQ